MCVCVHVCIYVLQNLNSQLVFNYADSFDSKLVCVQTSQSSPNLVIIPCFLE